MNNNVDIPHNLEILYENTVYYMPTLVKQAFEGNYPKYVSNGDNTSSIDECFNKIYYYLHK